MKSAQPVQRRRHALRVTGDPETWETLGTAINNHKQSMGLAVSVAVSDLSPTRRVAAAGHGPRWSRINKGVDMSGGVKAALDAAVEGSGGLGEVVQAGLFEDLEPSETGALDAPSPLSAALPSSARRPRGRPPGSKNRRTEAVTAWLLQQHRHPLSVMMEAYSMTPADLCRRIGVDVTSDNVLDVFKLQVRMAEAVAPYVAQRLPQAVQIDAKAGVSISFEGVSLPARAGSAGNPGDVIEGQLAVRLPEVGHEKSDDDVTS